MNWLVNRDVIDLITHFFTLVALAGLTLNTRRLMKRVDQLEDKNKVLAKQALRRRMRVDVQ